MIDTSTLMNDTVSLVLETLEQNGAQAWLVGGCVRDALLGRPIHDIDIACSEPWDISADRCRKAQMNVSETGTLHGTITVHCNGQAFEVTTFRSESNYSDKRHPDHVSFIDSIEEDLARRDFTMNALAWHPKRGLCDPFEGRVDLHHHIIRAVGDSNKRFEEDALRILRAVRFQSQLGFSIEPATQQGMLNARNHLACVSVERISHELDALLQGDYVYQALMEQADIICAVLPELAPARFFDQNTKYHIYDVYEHTAWAVSYTPANLLVRWATLLHDIGKPQTYFADEEGVGHFYGHGRVGVDLARNTLSRLHKPTKFIHEVCLLVRYHDTEIQLEPRRIKRMLRKLDESESLFRALCDVKRGDARAHAPQWQGGVEKANAVESALNNILEDDEVFTLSQLAINGNDLLQLSIQPGPTIGSILARVLEAVIDEELPNNREVLLAYAEKLHEEDVNNV